MPANSISDFLSTYESPAKNIICPACGNPMGLLVTGSYKMVLTTPARNELNNIIQVYRQYLKSTVEALLAKKNIFGFDNGTSDDYKLIEFENLKAGRYDSGGAKDVEDFFKSTDTLEVVPLLQEVPTLEDLKNGSNDKLSDKSEFNRIIAENLIGNLEPHTISGHVMDIVLEQEYVVNWAQEVEQNGSLLETFKVVQSNSALPQLYQYLVYLYNEVQEAKKNKENSKRFPQNVDRTKLERRIVRCMYVLMILWGHKSSEIVQKSKGMIKEDEPFALPGQVFLSLETVSNFLLDYCIVNRAGLKLSPDIVEQLERGESLVENLRLTDSTSDVSNKNLNRKIGLIQELVNKRPAFKDDFDRVVHFICTGAASAEFKPAASVNQKTVNSQSSGSSLLEKRSEFCGWYPKPEPTHPVLFIGSPGTGKSSVMVTGLTSFSTCRTTMRLKVEGVSKEDRAMIDHYQKSFFDGILPKRTETNVRYTVQLAIEDIRNSKNRVNFVFTDIPGEVAASGIQGQGTDPIVQSVLKTAETIVFFFDLGLEPSIFKALDLGSNKQAWEYMCDQYRKLQENRPAKVNQTDLLNRIMEEIREMRGEDGTKEIDFICVIPKADYYVSNSLNDS